MRRALEAVVARHGSLRMSFSSDGSTFKVHPEPSFGWRVVDLTSKSKSDRDSRIQAIEEKFKWQFFDLENPPLFEVCLVLTTDREAHMLMAAHHLVCDGYSFNLLVEELGEFYSKGAFFKGEAPSYMDYVVRENHPDQQEVREKAKRYWIEKYQDHVPLLDLPTDAPYPPELSFDGATESVRLDKELYQQVRKVGTDQGCTLFATLMAVYQVLLKKLTGQDALVIGIPSAGQNEEGFTDLVGHCVNFLPVLVDVSDANVTFAEFLKRVQDDVFDAFEHRDFTFGEILSHLPVSRIPGRIPLNEVWFNVERMDYFDDFEGLDAVFENVGKRFVKSSLFLNVIESEDGLTVEADYKTDILNAGTVRRWLSMYQNLLGSIVENPEIPISELSLHTDAEKRELLFKWNPKETDLPQKSIHELFEEQVRESPNRVALELGNQQMTYAELNAAANRVAHELLDRGVVPKPGVSVGVCMGRSFELVISLLGILKSGAGYVPLDTEYPDERLGYMIDDAGLTSILAGRDQLARIQRLVKPFVQVLNVEDSDRGNSEALENPQLAVDCEGLAYVIYTSGSTGKPKGVPVPHQGVVRLVRNTNYADLSLEQVYLQAAAISFDASTFEFWAPLLNGGKLALMPAGSPTLEGIGDAIKKHGVTTIWLTAGLFQLMVDERLEDLASIKQLLCGGDVVSMPHVRKVVERFPYCTVINGYGPTENTTFTTCHRVRKEDLERTTLPIGTPISNTYCYILDSDGNPVEKGVPGELYIGGKGLAGDYLNAPELSAERYLLDPFQTGVERRLYRSGDRCCYLKNGDIEFMGRMDQQAKIRGFRVEPEEVESVIREHPEVTQCGVVVKDGDAAEKILVAHVVTHLDTGLLMGYLKDRLPAYMLPSAIHILDQLPITPNGKVDYKKLRNIEIGETLSASEARVMPETDMERDLLEIWKEVLGYENLGVTDDFFRVGGHSLLGLKMFNEISKRNEISLPLATLFTAPTVRELAAILNEGKGEGEFSLTNMVAMQPSGDGIPIFCIHGGDGGVLFYRSLAIGLGTRHPVYGIESPFLTTKDDVPSSMRIEQVAEEYLKLISLIYPSGPVILAGYSYGGIVAYEMAQQRFRKGETGDCLWLFDTENPKVESRRYSVAERIKVQWKQGDEEQAVSEKIFRIGARFTSGLSSKWKLERENAKVKKMEEGASGVDAALRGAQLRESHEAIMDVYEPGPYKGETVLFRALDQGDKWEATPLLGWEGFIDRLSVVHVPGNHLRLFDPEYTRELTKAVRSCLPEEKN